MKFNVKSNDWNAIGIYEITNIINGHVYRGQTSRSFRIRFLEHCHDLKTGDDSPRLQKAFDKYGSDAFEFHILKICNIDDLDCEEERLISEARALGEDCCYNIAQGGKGTRGEANCFFGQNHSGENNGFFGRKHSEESKKSMSETKKQMAKENEQYHQQLIDKAKLATKKSAEVRSRKVICIDTGKIYNSIKEAAEDTGAIASKIVLVCSGKRMHAGGYSWMYIDAKNF